ncbi:MAG: hypothetical protein HY704_13015 [Gemmatimonadetes bacterium]|nr:hypothetical protein [Gemmatimonadota bacterium]
MVLGRRRALFGERARRFNEDPPGKLDLIRDLGQCRETVMMMDNGLNDAGASWQSDAGMEV